ncbi:MAG: exodeoxyribonuclease III [Pseudomonadota bacterium]
MGNTLRLISWNVNGLNAAMKKGFLESVAQLAPDILALQETKLQEVKLTSQMKDLPGYNAYWSYSTVKKGYSGTAVYARSAPARVATGIGIPAYDDEGRILEIDFGSFVLFNVYFPNGQMGPERLAYKLDFYRDFFAHANKLKEAGRYVVVTGDYNTAHNEIDLKNPKANENTSGFMRIERDWIDRIIADGWVDTFRHFYPDTVRYSWWTYRFNARARDVGWRIDYFFVSENMIADGLVTGAFIDNAIMGSDHCPVGLELRI